MARYGMMGNGFRMSLFVNTKRKRVGYNAEMLWRGGGSGFHECEQQCAGQGTCSTSEEMDAIMATAYLHILTYCKMMIDLNENGLIST